MLRLACVVAFDVLAEVHTLLILGGESGWVRDAELMVFTHLTLNRVLHHSRHVLFMQQLSEHGGLRVLHILDLLAQAGLLHLLNVPDQVHEHELINELFGRLLSFLAFGDQLVNLLLQKFGHTRFLANLRRLNLGRSEGLRCPVLLQF